MFLFPVSDKFDYRKLFSAKEMSMCHTLNKFNQPELLTFFDQFAKLSSSRTDGKKRLKLQMLLALLCNLVDRRSCFL